VIDFPYADADGLNLQGDARLLERMYCFHDPSDMDPSRWLVVVHVHPLLPWGDRRRTAASRLQVTTSVKCDTRPGYVALGCRRSASFTLCPKIRIYRPGRPFTRRHGGARSCGSPTQQAACHPATQESTACTIKYAGSSTPVTPSVAPHKCQIT